MASLKFNNKYINDYLTIAGPMECDSKLKKVDLRIDDYFFKKKHLN